MNATHDIEGLARFGKWLGHMAQGLIALTIAIAGVAGSPNAKADVIIDYNLNVTAQVSSYCCAVNGDYITITGTFAYDNTLGKITEDNLTVTGNLQGGNLPAGGVSLNTVLTSSEDSNDIFVESSDASYRLDFQFANSLGVGGYIAALNQPYTDGGDAQFYDSHDAYGTYHIGYFGVTGGAVPEPASLMLLSIPLLALAFIRRRAAGKRLSA